MDIKINKINDVAVVIIDGSVISNVSEYQVKSSASGETELIIKVTGNISVFDLSASLI